MFSIIIPVFNDRRIDQCLQSLFKNNLADCEVICVDNNSTDPEIKKILNKYKVKYLLEKNAGSYHARNTGAKNAEGDILIFTDSDCVPQENWVQSINKAFSKNIDGIMGKISGINKNKIAKQEQKFYEAVAGKFLKKNVPLKRIDTRNFAVKKNIFLKQGGFNEQLQFGGDMEFGARIHQAGYKIFYEESVLVSHSNETDMDKIINKRIQQNFDNYHILKFHNRNFIEQYFPHFLEINKYEKYYPLFTLYLPILTHMAKLFKNYFFYKYANIFAIKYGLLLNIKGKRL
jgi:glycosyltransferase involved in cell wall biosynthesis